MWSYLVRRLLLMIPTLLGVTIVSFGIMQLAPGDPILNSLGPGGNQGQTGQTPEAFLLQKRDLKLDRPWFLNARYYTDYRDTMRIVAFYRARELKEIERDLGELHDAPDKPEHAARISFLRSLGIDGFKKWFSDPAQHRSLARAVDAHVKTYCDDLGFHGVPATMAILEDKQAEPRLKLGAVLTLTRLIEDPFKYTFSREPSDDETEAVVATWTLRWGRVKDDFEALPPDVTAELDEGLKMLTAAETTTELYSLLENYDRTAAPFFAARLLGKSTLKEKAASALFLKLYVGGVDLDLPRDATEADIERVAGNWLNYYQENQAEFSRSTGEKLGGFIADTQYGHMLRRLVFFDFGDTAVKPREKVGDKLWRAFKISAPLMLMAQLVIYMVAVPVGIFCAVYRGRLADRASSLGLFFLYSIPPFVAGMMLLVLLCYGDFFKIFPMERLHSDGYENFSTVHRWLDYFWHAVLPVVCLSLFSLASVAMYSRSSMLDVVNQDYIRTARAKGLPRGKVIFKHALRNALIPIVTLFSSTIPAILGGSVLIERIFNIPGMGMLAINAIMKNDFPTLMALIYVEALVVLFCFLITDMLYVLIDPRISFSARGKAA